MLLTQYQKAMLSIVNESETKVFQQELLTIKIYPTLQQMGNEAAKEVADRICKLLEEKAEINMIFAAAPSQNEFLNHLIHDKRIDWTRINAFHMDEYIGIHPDAPQSFGHFLRIRIFDKVPFKKVNYLNGRAESLEEECKRYADLLTKYPVDIVCLGIGENGHIAFNDPDVADFNDPKLVKIVKLDPVCRQQQVNEKCFERLDLVPKEKPNGCFVLSLSRIKPTQYIGPFMVKFQKNVRQAYCEEKKNLRYIWTLKVQNR